MSGLASEGTDGRGTAFVVQLVPIFQLESVKPLSFQLALVATLSGPTTSVGSMSEVRAAQSAESSENCCVPARSSPEKPRPTH